LAADLGFWRWLENPQKNIGEIGILTAVVLHDAAPDKLFLRTEIDHVRYMGCLAFTDAMFCRQLPEFLQDHLGKSIKEIGDLDFSRTL
jgi:hypothetical protein